MNWMNQSEPLMYARYGSNIVNEHYIIIGSRMFKELFPDNPRIQKRCKVDADYDILMNPTLPLGIRMNLQHNLKQILSSKLEVHVNKYLWALFNDETIDKKNLYFTLKASHVSFHKHWSEKTFYDLYLMSTEGCQIIEPIFNELYLMWKKKFGEPWRADFTKESSDFFDDAVSRENVHDDLHKLVAYYAVPAFKFLQSEGQTTVWVSPTKFKDTTEHIRQRVVIEEAQTLALERFILPGKMKNKHIAYGKMIYALVDRLAPLWMSIYIINNLNYFLNYKEDYGKTKL